MSVKPVIVIAKAKAKPGKEAEVLAHLKSLIGPSRQDEGCLNYDLHRQQDDPSSFLFHETWESQEHLDRHLAKPDLQETLGRVKALLAEPPEITLWEKSA